MGTASAMPVIDRFQSAHVLEVPGRLFLIDCGEAVQRQMLRYHVSMLKLDTIFISHVHADHLLGLFPLLSTLSMGGRTAPVIIYGPSNLAPFLKFFLSYYGKGIVNIDFHAVSCRQPEVIYSTKSFEVLAFPLRHKIETYGYMVREKMPLMNVRKEAVERYGFTLSEIGALKQGKDILRPAGRDDNATFMNGFIKYSGTDEPMLIKNEEVAYRPHEPRSYAYCSDTAPFPELAEWVKGVDLLYHEATYLQKYKDQAEKRFHSTTLQAARCAADAGVKKLVIGHYSSRCRDAALYQAECRTVFPETFAANDGDVFEI